MTKAQQLLLAFVQAQPSGYACIRYNPDTMRTVRALFDQGAMFYLWTGHKVALSLTDLPADALYAIHAQPVTAGWRGQI